ncbi:hypothetical protein OOK39_01935 [Streptomyces sp. NBC_00264]|uniref:hypothetical protein n=1 Tax=unclassified Streptomyces TaxID=2593676 RepID=UPI00225B1740|nr:MULTISPECIES: hypothetical protein [unclassified Streptomyces]MCX5158061.1 hypothetical protein [Streptomyces sp. NBC_00305]MCX5216584.1 hypothetical protein [Streptomyces sp. NBC_00264]
MGEKSKAAGEGSAEATDISRIQLRALVQNPNCYPADAVAVAQNEIDKQEQRADDAALRDAAKLMGQCAAGNSPGC